MEKKKTYTAGKIAPAFEKRRKKLKSEKKSGGMFDYIYKRRKEREERLGEIDY